MIDKPDSLQTRQHIDRFLGRHYQHLRMDEVRHRTWGYRCDRLLADARSSKAANTPPKPCGRGWTGTKPPGCTRASRSTKKETDTPAASKPPTSKEGLGQKGQAIAPSGKTTPATETKEMKTSTKAVEDRDTLTKLAFGWNKKIQDYDAVLAVSKSEKEIQKLSVRKSFIEKEFGDGPVPIGRLPRLRMNEVQRTTERQSIDFTQTLDNKAAMAVFDDLISRHQAAIDAGKKKIKQSGIEVEDLNLARIDDNRAIAGALLEQLKDKKKKMIGIVSENGRLQSLMNWNKKKDSLYIEYLATAPENLDPRDPNRTKGGGTQAIVAAIRKSKEIGKDGAVSLFALPGAESFYTKLGFKLNKRSDTLKLSKEDAEEVLRKYG